MSLELRCLKTNPYTYDHEPAREGEAYAFWRIVEHTGAGWFPWPDHYATREEAERALERASDAT